MEIKTTEQILLNNTTITTPDLLIKSNNRKWVAVDDILKLIDKHKHCSQYHKIKKCESLYKGTCLSKIYEEIKNNT